MLLIRVSQCPIIGRGRKCAMKTLNSQIRELRKVSGLSQAMFAGNSILNRSKSARDNDEFYTTYDTVADEMAHYVNEFKGKTVLCNCDDPFESSFSKYFMRNFNKLELKGLICTSYRASRVLGVASDLVDVDGEPFSNENGYVMVLSKVPENITIYSTDDEILEFIQNQNLVRKLVGDGDFRSDECIEYLKLADIVVTNPPFSLFRQYIAKLMEYEKDFIIIGNQNAITYQDILPLIQRNKIWLGYNSGHFWFRVPDYYEEKKTDFKVDENGVKWRRMGNICWFTNIDIEKRHEDMILYKKYSPEDYPKYDNYDAIEVSRTDNIPCDYYGIMGVPITFMDKYNPDQFEIIGEANHGSDNDLDLFKPTIGGKGIFKRILIKRKGIPTSEN